MGERSTAGLSLLLTVAAAVDRARDRFEASWESGGRPRIEDYLQDFEEPGRSHLFRELLAAELIRRGGLGERPAAEEYRARFPDLSSLVDLVIDSTRDPEPRPKPARGLPEYFGRYRILKPLGRGGMGAVYLALDTHLDRRVALKHPHFGADKAAAHERFYREARAAATFDHPNLCPVFDVGQIDGIDYLTMPYLEGKPLSKVVNSEKPAVPRQVAAVIRKLALALDVAYRRGVVHRDLKPANIMACRSRELVIMDFGLARIEDGDDSRLTRTGVAMGTPAYMPPERAAGELGSNGPLWSRTFPPREFWERYDRGEFGRPPGAWKAPASREWMKPITALPRRRRPPPSADPATLSGSAHDSERGGGHGTRASSGR
jgi:serine/threonine protein kinase